MTTWRLGNADDVLEQKSNVVLLLDQNTNLTNLIKDGKITNSTHIVPTS